MIKTKNSRVKPDKSIGSLIFKSVCLILLVAYTLSIFLSFAIAIMTSLKPEESYITNFFGLPIGNDFTLNNYVEIFKVFKISVTLADGSKASLNIVGMFINSLIYAGGGAFFATTFCCITSYAVSKFPNWMSKVIYTIVIVCMALPVVGSLPSELQMLINLNLYDTQFGLVFLSSSFLGMHFLVFHASFKSIPQDFSEAAKIDGAGEWRIFLRIMLPLVKLTFFTIFLLKFMALWNNYETPLIHTPNHPVLALGVFQLAHNVNTITGSIRANTVPHKIAGAMIVLLPILILFLFTHKRLIGNVSMGGVKG